MSIPVHRHVAGAILAAAAVVVLAGCTAPSTAPSDSGETGTVSDAVLQRLADAVEVPTLTSPGDDVDVSAAEGKSVFVIPLFSTNQYNQLIDEAMVEAGALTGTDVTIYENQGSVNQWVAGINQAISSQADVIVLSGGIDPRLLLPQIAAAQEAGIKVISSQFFDEKYELTGCGDEVTLTCAAGLDAVVSAPYSLMGVLTTDWIIADSQGTASTLVLTSSDVGPNATQVAAIKDEFAAECPTCKVTYVDIPAAQWATNTQSSVQSALLADPTITHVLPVYDVMATDAATAIGVANKAGQVKVASFNGTPAVLGLIQSGDTVAADLGQNSQQIGYANMDQAYRLLAGVEPSLTSNDVVRLFTKDNVDEAGTPPIANGGFGEGYLDAYKKIWGLG